jgi:hypothetical protein
VPLSLDPAFFLLYVNIPGRHAKEGFIAGCKIALFQKESNDNVLSNFRVRLKEEILI